ncbi:PLP-dependent transferase [Hanseniaspora valbyensis NRRL Y-1626]|uniref:serine C-palmitoyltransferase n=1 Tax=Hanseniaspora valbyensis NRRL Y-1626 TaxID=766949 RepID=A0A1B7TGU1_9ASCO|nr:PLP-dependent transferase [Hanseniaspora valbyensis NRRL Y-1626]
MSDLELASSEVKQNAFQMFVLNNSLTQNALFKKLYKSLEQNYVTVVIMDYIKKSHQNDPYRTFVELIVLVIGIYYIIRNSKKNSNSKKTSKVIDNLTPKEFENFLQEWEPKPLVDPLDEKDTLFKWKLNKQPVITDFKGDKVDVITLDDPQNKKTDLYNLAHYNFLKLSLNPKYSKRLTTLTNKIIKNCGVGSCGPAGFYGNEDLHYKLEYDLAKFLGSESCVLYGQDFASIPSVLSTFNKRGDIIVADKLCNVAIQNALQLSRATVYYYDHNDMDDLERYLEMVYNDEKNDGVLHRRYIVTESIFQHNGQICKLDDLIELKQKYKFRLFIDETLSIGALGKTGKGITEFYGYPDRSLVDITVGSLGNSLGTGGGFVLGDATMSFFQRIGSNAYCFSASLPPYCCGVVSDVLQILEEDQSTIEKLHYNIRQFNFLLSEKLKKVKSHFIITSNEKSPMIVLKMSDKFRSKLFDSNVSTIYESINKQQTKQHKSLIVHEPFLLEEKFIQEEVIDKLIDLKIMAGLQPYSLQHESLPLLPGFLISVDALMELEDIENITDKLCEVLGAASRK